MDDEIIKLEGPGGGESILVTHQLRDAFYVATHMAERARTAGFGIVPANREKTREAEFLMLRDGPIVFEGDADALSVRRISTRKTFLSASRLRAARSVSVDLRAGSLRAGSLEDPSMPRTRSLAWSELKVGILTVVAMVIAASTISL